MLVELGLLEQRQKAVLEVLNGAAMPTGGVGHAQCPIVRARPVGGVRPDPAEVAAVGWVRVGGPPQLARQPTASPGSGTGWQSSQRWAGLGTGRRRTRPCCPRSRLVILRPAAPGWRNVSLAAILRRPGCRSRAPRAWPRMLVTAWNSSHAVSLNRRFAF
ncbi:MAG: hypothetical protein QOH66_1568 [Actinomycetota bacterium]|nr:hypothetical protein [Actinomycetota bacterium]